jgi:hypothetical protein
MVADPQFKDPGNGDFTPMNRTILETGYGLTDPVVISRLWKKYEAACK